MKFLSASGMRDLIGWRRDGVIATKLVGIIPGNPQRRRPLASWSPLVEKRASARGRRGAELTFSKIAADPFGSLPTLPRKCTRTQFGRRDNVVQEQRREHLDLFAME